MTLATSTKLAPLFQYRLRVVPDTTNFNVPGPLGTVVPVTDNFFATLNSAVFSDGSFVYIPPGVRCPMELSTYFRINEEKTGQFERTLIIADKGAYVSYLEGCTAPRRDENQLHAAVVELIALEDAEIKYSTVQNWYPGDSQGKGSSCEKRSSQPHRPIHRSLALQWSHGQSGSCGNGASWRGTACRRMPGPRGAMLSWGRDAAQPCAQLVRFHSFNKSKITMMTSCRRAICCGN